MGMSGGYGPTDDGESIATIHAALDAGITYFDTGDFYGMGHNEMLLGEALKGGQRRRAFLSVKFGNMRGPDGGHYGYDLRPAAVKNFLAYSLRRLKTDYIDLYTPSRYDRSGGAGRYARRDFRSPDGGICTSHRPVGGFGAHAETCGRRLSRFSLTD